MFEKKKIQSALPDNHASFPHLMEMSEKWKKENPILHEEFQQYKAQMDVLTVKMADRTGEIGKLKKKQGFLGVLCIIFLLTILIGSFYIKSVNSERKKLRVVSSLSEQLVGASYEEAVQKFAENGYDDVLCEPIYDLSVQEMDREGEVLRVVVGYDESINSKKSIKNDQIIILYHVLKDICPGISSKQVRGLQLDEVKELFGEAGFVNIQEEPIKDLKLGLLKKENEIEKVTIDGAEKFTANSTFRPDVEVVISYHAFQEKKQ